MRKIEIAMLAAIKAEKPFNMGNTYTTVERREDGALVTSVYLHSNLIAQKGAKGWAFKLCGWDTPTTRSRINALMGALYPESVPIGVHRVRGQLSFTRNAARWAIDSQNWIHPDVNVPQLGAVRTNK